MSAWLADDSDEIVWPIPEEPDDMFTILDPRAPWVGDSHGCSREES